MEDDAYNTDEIGNDNQKGFATLPVSLPGNVKYSVFFLFPS